MKAIKTIAVAIDEEDSAEHRPKPPFRPWQSALPRAYIARYDDLAQSTKEGQEEKIDVSHVDVSMNGIELQDREFFAAIREGREPNSSVQKVFNCYKVLHDLEQQLDAG